MASVPHWILSGNNNNNNNNNSNNKTCPCINIQRFFTTVKIENLSRNKRDILLIIFDQNIDCRYTLEPPRRGGSNEYPQSMFWKKHRYTLLYKSGV